MVVFSYLNEIRLYFATNCNSYFAENLFAWKIRSKNRKERPAIAYVWRLNVRNLLCGNLDWQFNFYRHWWWMCARARIIMVLCVTANNILWRSLCSIYVTTSQPIWQLKYKTYIFCCIRLHLPNRFKWRESARYLEVRNIIFYYP